MENEKIRILYVDDEKSNLVGFKSAFRSKYEIYTAESAFEGRKILDQQPIDIVFTDQRMPGMTGVEFLQSIIPIYPEPMRILITGYTDFAALVNAVNKGHIYRYIQKPWEEDDITNIISQAYEVFSLRKQNKKLTEDLIKVNGQLEFLLRQNLLS